MQPNGDEDVILHLNAFCGPAYSNVFATVILHSVYVGVMVVCGILLAKFIGMMNTFPVRERAPRIALLQTTAYFMIIIMIYIIELGFVSGYLDWDKVTDEDDIPLSRRVFKAFYFAARTNIYIIFLVRYMKE